MDTRLVGDGQYEPQDTAGDITKKIKMEVPDFEGRIHPIAFSDWIASNEEYFDWYNMLDEQRVRFAKIKLVELAKVWRTGVEGDNTWHMARDESQASGEVHALKLL